MTLSIIAAVADNNVIGRSGDLPWRLQADLRRFRELTVGHAVIVGRKTHESIVRRLGRPLPDRRTIVLSRRPAPFVQGGEVASSWNEAMTVVRGEDEVYVIGGAEIYALAMLRAERLYLTRVHAVVPGDAFFPPFDRTHWRVVQQRYHPRDTANEFDVTFEDFVRARTPVRTG